MTYNERIDKVIEKIKDEIERVPHSISDEAAYEIAMRNEGREGAIEILEESKDEAVIELGKGLK